MKKVASIIGLTFGTIGAIYDAVEMSNWVANWSNWVHSGSMTLEDVGRQGAGLGIGFVALVYVSIFSYLLYKSQTKK